MKPLPGEVDEVSRDRLRREAAVQWILENPLDWARLAVAKISYGWGTSSSIMSYVSADRMPPREEDVSKALLNVGWGALFVWCAAASLRTRIWSRAALLPADVVEEGVGGDPAEPALEGAGLVGDEASLHSHQHLLDQVLRVVVVAAQAVGHRVDEAPVRTGHLLPGGYDPAGGGVLCAHANAGGVGWVPGRTAGTRALRASGPRARRPGRPLPCPT